MSCPVALAEHGFPGGSGTGRIGGAVKASCHSQNCSRLDDTWVLPDRPVQERGRICKEFEDIGGFTSLREEAELEQRPDTAPLEDGPARSESRAAPSGPDRAAAGMQRWFPVRSTPASARHQQATLSVSDLPGAVGYLLAGVPYGIAWPPDSSRGALAVAIRHAAALGITELTSPLPDDSSARQAGTLALALYRLASGQALSTEEQAVLLAHHAGAEQTEVVIRTDGSADKQDGTLSIGYTLNDAPYAAMLPTPGHESMAEREAIRTALSHARLLGYSRFRVRSDHLFHVRRYDEDLIHPERRKSETLERLDELVASLGSTITFEYSATRDTDAPHRFANHARALYRLAREQPLSPSQQVALRRVHFALRTGETRLY
ncbi:hypothetical protein MF271_20735 (plasmid) [Deinococcus sp. KNUC1210]|uniref:hypothetical protein n=1 Tax=Deinococcus sp. KNUC1210 TaxID=2917691 RepID=UPI001EF1410E|nr:hypothetical protein [Deinococcus sp. KNUC1210]ULH17486.1 hypothetical protein MF271_20735 [Deinococcus sp. KNUC1210]